MKVHDKYSSSLKSFLEIIPDAIVIVDSDGKIQFINSQVSSIFGFQESELIGKEIEILIPSRYKAQHTKHRKNYSKKPIKRPMGAGIDLYGKRKNGDEFPVDIMLSPFTLGEDKSVIGVVRDIGNIKETEETIKKQANNLEDIVSALTHDLKTPLIAADRSFNQLLEGAFGDLSDTQMELIKLLIKNNSDSLKLVKNLLSVFKYEMNSYNMLFSVAEISEVLNKAASVVNPILKEKNLQITLPPTKFKFSCDSFEIERVLVNLLTNAIRFSNQDGKIDIKAVKDQDGKVIISVEDHGCGMKDEEVDKVFNRLWQSRTSNSSSQSTGLGLYLCKKIVESHKGRIYLESALGKGTRVTIELPELVY